MKKKKIITDQETNETQAIFVCEKCGEREATHEHHTIFEKETNKSDKNSPTQDF